MQKFIDDLIQALYPAAELFLLLWYRAFALFYTLYGTLTHFTERLQGTAKMFSSLHKLYRSMVDTG